MPHAFRILVIFSLFTSTLQLALAYKTIIDVLSEDSRFGLLIEHLQRARLVPIVNKLEAGTLFAPDNSAFENYKDKEVSQSLLLYHLLPVGMTGQDFYHGQLVESLYIRPGLLGSDDTGQRIKITKDGNQGKGRGKVYINGVEIVEKDLFVNNQTYIQVINQVLEPPPMLPDVIKMNKELYSLMEKAGVHNILNQPQPYTVFIPRQNVLSKMNPIEQTYMTSKYGEQDLTQLLKFMIMHGPLYGYTFPSGKTLHKSLAGESLVVGVDKNSALTVNGANVAEVDILAANGVVHIVDDVLMPGSLVFNARKYLYGMNATKLVSLMDRHGLAYYLEDDTRNVTIIAPLNESIDEEAIPNKEKKNWLQYHLVDGSWPTNAFYDSMLLRSEFHSPRLADAPQRIPVHLETEKSLVLASAPGSKSVRFDHSRALSEPVSIKGDVIYTVSEPLALPGDILSTLVIDLELSTFIATLYVSEVADDIKKTPAITMFVPTNDAFQELGLVAKYLVHPAGKEDLQTVLRYHVAKTLLYKEDMQAETHEVTTLANATLRVNPTEDGKIQVGRPDTPSEVGSVATADILVRNGVVHKLDRVQVPSHVTITAQDILEGTEANTMIELLKKAGLLPMLDKQEYILLAPTDTAFAHIDVEALLADQYQLERVAKLHLIPVGWQDKWLREYSSSQEYPTLLSDKDKLTMRETETGELLISVKDQSNGPVARVTGMGKTYGGVGGGVLQTDTVLIPIRRGFFGLPWGWSIVLVTGLSLLGSGILGVVGFFVYKIWTRRRLGYRSISSS